MHIELQCVRPPYQGRSPVRRLFLLFYELAAKKNYRLRSKIYGLRTKPHFYSYLCYPMKIGAAWFIKNLKVRNHTTHVQGMIGGMGGFHFLKVMGLTGSYNIEAEHEKEVIPMKK